MSENSGAATVIAVHGITASHLAWAAVVRALPDQIRVVAPDLRGRGRSAGLPGPYGMAQHAADLAAVAEALDLPPAIVVGHSMGGFVALVAAHRHPDRFHESILVDGGLPLAVPAGVSREHLLEATLGPAAARLSMTFPDHPTYLEFWRQHPAFAEVHEGDSHGDLQQVLADYARYDLTGTEPELHPCTSLEAVTQDVTDLFGGGPVMSALGALDKPVSLLTAPRGLLNETPGLYSSSVIERWRAELPAVTISQVPEVNHYTIIMGAAGASAVASEVLRVVGLQGDPRGSAR